MWGGESQCFPCLLLERRRGEGGTASPAASLPRRASGLYTDWVLAEGNLWLGSDCIELISSTIVPHRDHVPLGRVVCATIPGSCHPDDAVPFWGVIPPPLAPLPFPPVSWELLVLRALFFNYKQRLPGVH